MTSRTVHSHSPGGASVHPIYYTQIGIRIVPVLPSTECL